MTDYKNKLGSLANKLKTEEPKTPIQEVNPIKLKNESKELEGQLNVWIPKSLLKRLKSVAVDKDMTAKEITINALTEYLNKSM